MGEQDANDIKKNKLNKTIYDNAKNHFLGNFPEHLPIEQAYVHIGIYLGWVIDSKLYSDFFSEEAETEIYRFSRREFPCTILSEIWDGYLGFELFNEVGNLFTNYYYGGGLYHRDYRENLANILPSIYHVEDTWDNYEKMSKIINTRFEDWKRLIHIG
ncbi:DUF7832 domain-containing protein [Aureibacter tunicatorum]|uniref:DUF7832 domain-containing protein n=1 Tax=Aureibacter tunicatorum TaxID=866807 RepID=A0AAE3XM45_9BACT|nr:hypothetical protein [Aureibacter tunicatorum]MDR6238957.1 hypothetical protein [Aureibacter tunicatorum]BDD05117.1 hypothetical protein AUTU_26000 [Aureibacter tunicatorum]